jgi:hypothetical protein
MWGGGSDSRTCGKRRWRRARVLAASGSGIWIPETPRSLQLMPPLPMGVSKTTKPPDMGFITI